MFATKTTRQERETIKRYRDRKLTVADACRKLDYVRANGKPDFEKFNRLFRRVVMSS